MEMGKCFIDKKKCSDKCVLYRRGVRKYDGVEKPVPFEECAINIAVDCLENLVGRNIALQQEMNLVRNATEGLNGLLALGLAKREEEKQLEDSNIKVID